MYCSSQIIVKADQKVEQAFNDSSLYWAKVKMDIADNNLKESSRELESTAELKIYGTGNYETKMDKPILGQNNHKRKVYFSTNGPEFIKNEEQNRNTLLIEHICKFDD